LLLISRSLLVGNAAARSRVPPPWRRSTLHAQGSLDPIRAQIDQIAAQHTVVRLGAGVYAQRLADSSLAARLVDVAVNSEDRLERLDRLPDAGRAHGAAQKVAGRDRRLQRRREEWGPVQTGIERRDVGNDHRLAH